MPYQVLIFMYLVDSFPESVLDYCCVTIREPNQLCDFGNVIHVCIFRIECKSCSNSRKIGDCILTNIDEPELIELIKYLGICCLFIIWEIVLLN